MRLPCKVLLFTLAGLALLAFPQPSSGKFHPKLFRGRYKVTKYDMESLVDGKMVAAQPCGGSVLRSSQGFPIIFFTDPSGGRIQFQKFCDAPDVDTIAVDAYGGWGTEDGNYKLPHHMAIWDGSEIYIADTGNDRIARALFDPANFTTSSRPPIGTGAGLALPEGVDVYDIDGVGLKVYVADTDNHRIVRLSEDGNLEAQYGSFGSGQGYFNHPQDIAKHGDFVYVADTYNGRVVALMEDPDGSFDWWGSYSPAEDLPLLVSVDCDTSGNVFVVDKAYCRILKLTEGLGEFLRSDGTRGIYSGQFLDPRSISICNPSNDVVVVESWTDYSGLRLLGNQVEIMERTVIPSSFDASEEETEVSFKIDDVAWVTIEVLTEEHQLVNTLLANTLLPAGTHEGFVWDGKDSDGRLVLPGGYYIRITADDTYGSSDVEPVDVTVEGTVVSEANVSGVWTADGEPYVVKRSIAIPNDQALTIEPGVKVMFWSYDDPPYGRYRLWASGELWAVGTADDSIRFASYKKEADRERSDWMHIMLLGQPDHLEYAVVEYGGAWDPQRDLETNIYVSWDGSQTIADCTIRESKGYGVFCCNDGATQTSPEITNCLFTRNSYYPLRIRADLVGDVSTSNTFVDNGIQGIQVIPDVVTTTATWARCDDAGWFYDVEDYVRVEGESGPVLAIAPGVTLRFGLHGLQVGHGDRGGLRALGKPDSLIEFTSVDPDPAPGAWRGISFDGKTIDESTVLDYCVVQYAGDYNSSNVKCSECHPTISNSIVANGGASGISLSWSSPEVTDCVISQNASHGVSCDNSSSPTIRGTTISRNQTGICCQQSSNPAVRLSDITENQYGVKCELGSTPTINHCNISGNTEYGVQNVDITVTVDAVNNWWGHGTGPCDPSPGPPDHNLEGQGDMVSDYVAYRPWRHAPLIFSDDSEATAWSNSHKILSDGANIWVVYQSGGEIRCRHSPDKGQSWSEDFVVGEGETPAIAMNPVGPVAGCPGVVWIGPKELPEGRRLYYARYDPGHHPPWRTYTLAFFGDLVRPYLPSFAIDTDGYGHVVWEVEKVLGPRGSGRSTYWWLWYGYFSAQEPDDVLIELIDSASSRDWHGPPSVAVDDFNRPHVIWRKNYVGEIYYSTREPGGWTTPENISETPDFISSWPSLDFYEGMLSAIWQEEVNGAFEIRHRPKLIETPWSQIEEVTSTGVDSYHPVIIAGKAAVWAETVAGNTDIFYSLYEELGWTIPEPVSTTDKASMYPHMALLPGLAPDPSEVWLCWTEGDLAPYVVQLEVAPFTVPEGKGSNSGHITKDTVWDTDVHITGDVWIDPGVTLTIEPGVRVQFTASSDDQESGVDPGRAELIVMGHLKLGVNEIDSDNPSATSSEKNRVVFTSDASKPAPGDWYGIRFVGFGANTRQVDSDENVTSFSGKPAINKSEMQEEPGSLSLSNVSGEKLKLDKTDSVAAMFSEPPEEMGWKEDAKDPGGREESCEDMGPELAKIEGCWVGYAVRGVSISSDRSLELRDWVLTQNSTGMYCSGSSSPVLRETKIYENTTFGIHIEDSAVPNVGDQESGGYNLIYQNGEYNLYNNTVNAIAAELNYWGTQDSEEISGRIWHGANDPSLGVVDFEPFWNPAGQPQGGAQSAKENLAIPEVFRLYQNYPNPCGRITIIPYSVPTRRGDAETRRGGDLSTYQHINLSIYDLSGRLVRTLVDQTQEPGYYSSSWDGRDRSDREVVSGVYFYRLIAGDYAGVKKMILVK